MYEVMYEVVESPPVFHMISFRVANGVPPHFLVVILIVTVIVTVIGGK